MDGYQFLNDSLGVAGTGGRPWHVRRAGFAIDPIYDLRLRFSREYRQLQTAMHSIPPQRILIVGVEVPSRAEMMRKVKQHLTSTFHDITILTKEVGNKGKLENINTLLSTSSLPEYDWVIMTDDDIDIKENFIDLFVYCCYKFRLKVAMPAHRFGSYVGYELTKRHWGTVARATNFVEVGPITIFHRDTFEALLPFPNLKYGWGADFHWPFVAKQRGWRIGVVDAAPMTHLRPIGAGYSREEAVQEASSYLDSNGFLPRKETFSVVEAW